MSVIYYPGYSQQQVHQNLLWRTILSVTQSFPAVVTTSVPHGYVAGMKVRFLIPTMFGMQELNQVECQVISITDTTLNLDLDTRNFSIFSYPGSLPSAYTPPSVFPNSSGPYLPPLPLPYGNQNSFEGVIFNDGIN